VGYWSLWLLGRNVWWSLPGSARERLLLCHLGRHPSGDSIQPHERRETISARLVELPCGILGGGDSYEWRIVPARHGQSGVYVDLWRDDSLEGLVQQYPAAQGERLSTEAVGRGDPAWPSYTC